MCFMKNVFRLMCLSYVVTLRGAFDGKVAEHIYLSDENCFRNRMPETYKKTCFGKSCFTNLVCRMFVISGLVSSCVRSLASWFCSSIRSLLAHYLFCSSFSWLVHLFVHALSRQIIAPMHHCWNHRWGRGATKKFERWASGPAR